MAPAYTVTGSRKKRARRGLAAKNRRPIVSSVTAMRMEAPYGAPSDAAKIELPDYANSRFTHRQGGQS